MPPARDFVDVLDRVLDRGVMVAMPARLSPISLVEWRLIAEAVGTVERYGPERLRPGERRLDGLAGLPPLRPSWLRGQFPPWTGPPRE